MDENIENNKSILLRYRAKHGSKLIKINIKPPEKKEIQTGYIGIGVPITQIMQQPEKKTFEKKLELKEGIEIPKIETEKIEIEDVEELSKINLMYPLIPREPKKGEKIFAYANIFFDTKTNELVYNVVEPVLDKNKIAILNEIKDYIQEKIDINFAQVRKKDAIDYLIKIFDKAIGYFKVKSDIDILRYYVLRDFIGLEKIEPLIQDKMIEDISCDGINIPIFVYHRDPRFGSLKTNIVFSTKDELDSFVNKLAERCGKTISVARPLLDGTLPDGSRVQATLGSDIARHGSNFTIRMFTERPLTPVDIIKFGTCDLKMMAYFWLLVEHGFSIIISGGTATGKTSLLNVLSLFIKPQMKIVSIEDTAELRLPHSHWVPEIARTPVSEEGKVDMFELLKESLRQRPDYIIVGEVRGREAYVLFQQMAVGHSGLSTIHAENFPKLIDRLTTPPINLPANLIQNVDLIVFVKRVRKGRKYQRRAESVIEIVGYDVENKVPITNEVMVWDPIKDTFNTVNKSFLLYKISTMTGMNENDIKKSIEQRAKILKWMVKHNIIDYKKISSVINLYYTSPDFLLRKIEGEL
ncbi:MAG: type II/IV secretion system ATPase subunit [Candidatus Aenigmatarchaeota archaeon]